MSIISANIYDNFPDDYQSFENKLRSSIVGAARDLDKSGMSFATFKKSRCNPDYWDRTGRGGFRLRKDVPPSDAIKDIYIHGSMYATECSTAIVIIYYKALVDLFPAELFNELFDKLYLYDWRTDSDLGVHAETPSSYLPGDCRYFVNPGFNPDTPEWQGENTIDLGDGTFYGHGIGIATPEQIIMVLNKFRKKGAKQSAYLSKTAVRPNFKYLSSKYHSYTSPGPHETAWRFINPDLGYRVRMINAASAFSRMGATRREGRVKADSK